MSPPDLIKQVVENVVVHPQRDVAAGDAGAVEGEAEGGEAHDDASEGGEEEGAATDTLYQVDAYDEAEDLSEGCET